MGIRVRLYVNDIGQTASGDNITNVEQVFGSRFSDDLAPSNVQFSLASGGGGNDHLYSSKGTYDRIRGDDGFDILVGDAGTRDDIWLQYDRGFDYVFYFRILDEDHIVVDSDEFNLATQFGFISPSEFQSNGQYGASNPSIRLIYVQQAQLLFADKDGSGTAFDAVPIALFDAGTVPTSNHPAASHIFVF